MPDKKRVPAARFVRKNDAISALMSKLVENKQKEKAFVDEANSYNVMTQTASLQAISKDVQESAKNTESIISLFPDMELSMQILISSIISPKDMMGDELIYKVSEDFLTPDITNELVLIVKEDFEKEYKVREELPDMLKEILFISGAFTIAIIPESELDVIINNNTNLLSKGTSVTTESLQNKRIIDQNNNFYDIGILGTPKKEKNPEAYSYTFESLNRINDFTYNPSVNSSTPIEQGKGQKEYDRVVKNYKSVYGVDITPEEKVELRKILIESHKNLIITDNPDTLKTSFIVNEQISALTHSALKKKFPGFSRMSNEDMRGTPDSHDLSKIRDALYKDPSNKPTPFANFSRIKPLRKNIGRPLVMHLPSESIIPVHTPGEPDNHVGYFVLVDHNGSPLHMVERITALTELDEGLMEPDTSMNSILVQRAQDNIRGKNIKGMSLDNALPIYTNLIEQELLSRLESGIYGKNVEMAKVNEIYKIMLARTLKNQMTKLVYMPIEMVEYMRYKIHENGVGKALAEDLRILLSIRAMMLFSRLMGSIKNSIGITEINLKLDERDPDPLKTIEITKNEVLRARQQNFPIGISTPMDLADWVQRSGLEFTFEGHPRIPDVKLEYNQHGPSNIMPDEALDEDLRKRTIMAYGLSPESVDNGFSPDFATTVVNNNLLLSKRVVVIQKTILAHLKSLLTKIVMSDAIIMGKLVKVLNKNITEIKKLIKVETDIPDATLIDFIIGEFIKIIEIELPMPDTVSLDSQSASFDKYQEFLDKALDAWVGSEMFTQSLAGDLGNEIGTIKAVIKSYYTRKWLAENGVLEELGDITQELSASNLYDVQKEFMSRILKDSVGFMTSMQEMTKAVNKDLKNYNVGGLEGGGDYTGGEEEGGEGAGDEFGDLGEGADDFGLDGGLGEGGEGEGMGEEGTPAEPTAPPAEGEEPAQAADTVPEVTPPL